MISTSEIVIIVFLVVLLALAIWWFAVSYKYGKTLDNFSYTRGANLDTGIIGDGKTGMGQVTMSCELGSEICVYKADAICTGAINSMSNVEGGPEPISNGKNSDYGDFDPTTTINLTHDISNLANGKQTYTYDFNATRASFNGKLCPYNQYDQKTGSGQRPQLIATYTCIPKGTKCTSSPKPVPPQSDNFQVGNNKNKISQISINNNKQICGVNSSNELYCADNYSEKESAVWNKITTIPQGVSSVSLSDGNAFVTEAGDLNNVYYSPNYKTTPFKGYGATGDIISSSSNSTTLCSGGKHYNTQDKSVWCKDSGQSLINLNSEYSAFSVNNIGNFCGIKQGTNSITCYDSIRKLNTPINVKSVPVVDVALNNKGELCAITTSGDTTCTSSYNNTLWSTMPISKNKISNISMNDSGTLCGSNNNGQVWCSSA